MKSPSFTDTKVYRVYEKLDDGEKKKFQAFLRSPYFNTSRKLVAYWEKFERFGHKKKGDKSLVAFYRKLHPERVPDQVLSPAQEKSIQNKVRKLNAEIWPLLQEFIGLETYQGKPLLKQTHMFEGIQAREPKGGFEEFNFHALEEKVAGAKVTHYQLNLLHQQWASRIALQHTQRNQPLAEDFEKAVSTLDESYFTQRVLYEMEQLMLGKKFEQKLDVKPMDVLIPYFEDQVLHYNPLARGGYYLYQASREPGNPAHLENLLNLIEQYQSDLEEPSIRNLATGALNLLISLANVQEEVYLPKLQDGYQKMLKKKWILIDGKLEVRHFNNLITALLRAGKVSEAHTFNQNWKDRLLSDAEELAQLFNQGKITLAQGKAEKAQSLFRKLFQKLEKEHDFLFDIHVRLLLIRTNYQTKDWDSLDLNLANFLPFMNNRAHYPELHKASALKYLKVVGKLSTISQSVSVTPQSLSALEDLVKKEPRPVMKAWLLEEIHKLRGGPHQG